MDASATSVKDVKLIYPSTRPQVMLTYVHALGTPARDVKLNYHVARLQKTLN